MRRLSGALSGLLALIMIGAVASVPPALAFFHTSEKQEAAQPAPKPVVPVVPVVLVEQIEGAPASKFQAFDYLYAGQGIDLGSSGSLVLSYLNTCLIERIKGGRVTVGPAGSKVVNGMLWREETPCQVSRIEVTDSTVEAAGTVYRVVTFSGEDWTERTIKGDRPLFKWETANLGALAGVVVLEMDRARPEILWRGVTDKTYVAYPMDAPSLQVGMPYQVQITAQDGRLLVATFSFDPDMDGSNTVLSRLVPVELTAEGPR